MDAIGQVRNAAADGDVLHWPGRVVSAEDLRQLLNGHRKLVLEPRTIVTPLAADLLRANDIRVVRADDSPKGSSQEAEKATWGYTQERPHPLVNSVVQSLRRQGVTLRELSVIPRLTPAASRDAPCRWARAVAESVAGGACWGGVIFCQDAGLVSCVANKVAGVRAVAVASVLQAGRAVLALGANLVVITIPGPTFFELRQILRTLCGPNHPACPADVAHTLQELDGHAHR